MEVWAVQVDPEYAQDDNGSVATELGHHVVHVVLGVYSGEWKVIRKTQEHFVNET